ncbi:hypothetical protein [Fibrobacter sp.]
MIDFFKVLVNETFIIWIINLSVLLVSLKNEKIVIYACKIEKNKNPIMFWCTYALALISFAVLSAYL